MAELAELHLAADAYLAELAELSELPNLTADAYLAEAALNLPADADLSELASLDLAADADLSELAKLAALDLAEAAGELRAETTLDLAADAAELLVLRQTTVQELLELHLLDNQLLGVHGSRPERRDGRSGKAGTAEDTGVGVRWNGRAIADEHACGVALDLAAKDSGDALNLSPLDLTLDLAALNALELELSTLDLATLDALELELAALDLTALDQPALDLAADLALELAADLTLDLSADLSLDLSADLTLDELRLRIASEGNPCRRRQQASPHSVL